MPLQPVSDPWFPLPLMCPRTSRNVKIDWGGALAQAGCRQWVYRASQTTRLAGQASCNLQHLQCDSGKGSLGSPSPPSTV
jgi:hypothetical protein